MRTRAVAFCAILALVAVACGAADESVGVASADQLAAAGATTTEPEAGDAAAGDPGELDDEQALLSFTACMREQGVDVGDPVVDPDGNLRLDFRSLIQGGDVDREAIGEARQACAGLLEGVAQRFDAADRTEIEDRLLAFAACMRDNGVDMPDPDFDAAPGAGGGPAGGGGPFGDLDSEDPAFQEALGVCQGEFGDVRLRPGGGGGPGGGRGPGGGG